MDKLGDKQDDDESAEDDQSCSVSIIRSESLCHCLSQCDLNPIYATDVKLSLMSLLNLQYETFHAGDDILVVSL